MPDEQRPILSVIIVSYNTRELTLRCLSTLYPELADMPAEVFVVDNGSSDDSVAAVRTTFPKVVMIEVGRNAGFGAANNMALARALGEYVLLLNSDAFVQSGAVAAMVGYLRGHPETAVVGPRLLNRDGSLQPSCYRFPSPFRAVCEHLLLTAKWPNHPVVGDYRAWPHDRVRNVDFVIGACLAVRRSAIQAVGLFDENFFLYAEETDWCYRFHQAGWDIAFLPDAEVVHLGGESGKPQTQRVFIEFRRASERYMRKHHGLIGLWVFRLMLVVGSCIRIAAFTMLATVRPSRRNEGRRLVAGWARILAWSLGLRGPGLAS